jgi:hypothetical protein
MVMPVLSVKFPKNTASLELMFPVNVPLKVKFLILLVPERPMFPVPAVTSKLIEFASDMAPVLSVLAVPELFVSNIRGVPVIVHVVEPVNTVPVVFTEIVFVPNAKVPVNPDRFSD